MARTNNNKYTSINFNHILHKDHLPSSSATTPASGSYSSVARSHGRMLVLSRPSPKPLSTKPLTSPTSVSAATGSSNTTPPISPAPSLRPRTPDQAPSDPDPIQISLRPLGRTGPGPAPAPAPSLSSPVRNPEVGSPVQPIASPKQDRFVPPHLRPGFVGREAKPVPDASRVKDPCQRLPHQQHHLHQQQHKQQPQQQMQHQRPGYFGSTGLYGQNGRPKSGGNERFRTDPDHLGRPRSSGSRPGST